MLEAFAGLIVVCVALGILAIALPVVAGAIGACFWLLLLPFRLLFGLLLLPLKAIGLLILLPLKLIGLVFQFLLAILVLPVVLLVALVTVLGVLGGLGVLGLMPIVILGLPIAGLIFLLSRGSGAAVT